VFQMLAGSIHSPECPESVSLLSFNDCMLGDRGQSEAAAKSGYGLGAGALARMLSGHDVMTAEAGTSPTTN